MKVNLCGVELKNPVMPASGTFNFGREFEEFYDISKLGAVVTKGLTLKKRLGNLSPRVCETKSGMLNSVGLQNPGIDSFLMEELPNLKKKGVTVVANLAGSSLEDYVEICEKVNDSAVDLVELNISCPNVKEGGIAFGVIPKSVKEITEKTKKVLTKKPLIVKLTPNVANIKDNAKAVEDGGGDGVSLINTLSGMAIDLKSRRPILKNVTGGLSGPCVKPVALKMVWDVFNTVKIPIVGMGGIETFEDALEFIVCGATCVEVGSANLYNPFAAMEIVTGIENYLKENNVTLNELKGSLKI